MDKELSRTRKELYKAQALLRSRQDDLEASRAEMSRVRGEGDELRNELNETRAEVMMLKERLEEAEARCKEAMEEKEAARKLADAARHDMFEERRAKRLLQVVGPLPPQKNGGPRKDARGRGVAMRAPAPSRREEGIQGLPEGGAHIGLMPCRLMSSTSGERSLSAGRRRISWQEKSRAALTPK